MKFFNRRFALLTISTIIFTSFTGMAASHAAVISFPGERPFKLFVPSSYNKDSPAPLILALHGYRSSGNKLESYLNLTAVAQVQGILYVHPDGTADKAGTRFWNATPECCDFGANKINDDGYLLSVIDEVSKKYNVDPLRIYIIGHSNGGFMANRMACAHADRIAAVVSLAGATYENPSACKPTSPINVLQIWGTSDETYAGNHILGRSSPGALKTVSSWVRLDRCSRKAVVLTQALDLDRKIKGEETIVSQYQGCATGATVEFWTIVGGDHVPAISKTFTSDVVDFLMAHPKMEKVKNDPVQRHRAPWPEVQ
jgi:polyhydroxybutyrate depolymerase